MSLFGRAERREIAGLLAEAAEDRARIQGLVKALQAADTSHRGGSARQGRMASSIISLERELKVLRLEHAAELEKVRAELAAVRRLLATTEKQLDDATRSGDVGLLTVRPGAEGPKPGEVR